MPESEDGYPTDVLPRRESALTREEHLKKIWIVGAKKVGKYTRPVAMCSGPDCAGAELIPMGLTVADLLAEADAHIDKMKGLAGG